MFHHRALNCFVGCPVGRVGETPYLKRDALARGVHDAHENLLVVADGGIVEEPLAHVGPEKTEIRVAGAVDHRQAGRIVRMSECTELFDVGPDDGILLRDGIDHLLCRGCDGVGVDNHRLHDSPAAAVLHAAPVLKRCGDEGVGGQSDNRVVEILNFHGRQGHVGHNSVSNCRGDDNPVAHTQHIVLRELQSGHESENTVLEHQHQHRGEGAEACEQFHGRLIDYYRDYDDDGDEPQHAQHGVEYAAQRQVLAVAGLVEAYPGERGHGTDGFADGVGGVDEQHAQHHAPQSRFDRKSEGEQREHHERRNYVAAMNQHMVLDELLAEIAVADEHEFSYSEENNRAHKPSEKEGEADDYRRINHFLDSPVFFEAEKVKPTVDMDQKPLGDLIGRYQREYHNAIVEILKREYRPASMPVLYKLNV